MKTMVWNLQHLMKTASLQWVNRLGLLPYLNFSTTLAFENDVRVHIPILAGTGYANLQTSEPWMLGLLRKVLTNKGGVFIDIGANIGQTLLKLKRVAPEMEYYGFEPNPTCAAYLLELIRVNLFEMTRIIPTGIYEKPTLLDLVFYAKDNTVDSGASVMNPSEFRPQHSTVGRQCVSLYSFDKAIEDLNIGGIDIIKIDVEGAELEVLKGTESALAKLRPVLLLEILPMGNPDSTYEKNRAIEHLLQDCGYVLHRVKKDNQRLAGLVRIDEIGANMDQDGWDYVSVPQEKMGVLVF